MNIIQFENLKSTNLYVKNNFDALNNFDVISADMQENGHGQFERFWFSSNTNGGNCYITIVLKPKKLDYINKLTLFTSRIVANTLMQYGLKPTFKYPNDVLVNSKKISGILAESTMQGKNLRGIALGIGVNLNLSKDELINIDQPATSIYIETLKNINKLEFIQNLLDNFEKDYYELVNNGKGGNIDV